MMWPIKRFDFWKVTWIEDDTGSPITYHSWFLEESEAKRWVEEVADVSMIAPKLREKSFSSHHPQLFVDWLNTNAGGG